MKLNFNMENLEYGYVLNSDQEVAQLFGLSEQTIKKYNRTLKEKGYLDIINVNGKEIKRFNLYKM